MSTKPSLLCVDDEEFNQSLIEATLGELFEIELAANGEEALLKVVAKRPDLIILDVDMPVMDGYECCRRIKSDDDFAEIPVLFLSAKDAIEDRLQGFEAGGDDYQTKPFNFQLLTSKINALLALSAERHKLKESVSFANSAAMTAICTMSEYGCVLDAMRQLNESLNYTQLVEATLNCLTGFGLEGVVQLRAPSETVTQTSKGPASPLDLSIINHMAEMDRITQFKSRLSITYPCATLLITNMPTEDEDRCGRLRDHLALLAQAIDVRVQGIAATIAANEHAKLISGMIIEITETLGSIDKTQRDTKAATTLAVHGVTMSLQKALLGVEISHTQEAQLTEVLNTALDNIVQTQNYDLDVQNKLSSIISRMKDATRSLV